MYYHLLSRIKNGQQARLDSIQAPFSKYDFAVAKTLEQAGYVANVQKRVVGKRTMLELELKYKNNLPAITDFRIVSKPSRRLYTSYSELKPVKQNFGISVLSTSAGIMSNREARRKKVGGEHLFQIW
jgi:small subunit ribosomal protein S8